MHLSLYWKKKAWLGMNVQKISPPEAPRIPFTPNSVDIDITNTCNLKCKYCSFFSSAGDVETELDTQEWLTFFTELKRLAVLSVTLEGGEPFLRQDFQEILSGIVKNNMRFSILSNGTLITPEMAQFIAATKRCGGVQVSIDGAEADIHDAARGKGNFNKAVNGIRALLAAGVQVQIRVTINRYNVHHLEETARFLLEELHLPAFSTNSASHMGLCRKNSDEIQLTVEERSYAMKTLLQLLKEYPGRISAAAGPLAEARMWSKMLQAYEQKQPMSHRGFLTGCGGIFNKLGVRADGVVVPCLLLNHMALGRVNQDDFKEIFQSHPVLQKLRARYQMPIAQFEFCNACEYAPYCTGSCPGTSYNILGAGFENYPSPEGCLKRFLDQGGVLPESYLLTEAGMVHA